MKIRRSLSPRRIFFEQEGVVKKLTIKGLEARRAKVSKTGWSSSNGVMVQWGVSGEDHVIEEITFPMAFRDTPTIQMALQGARYTLGSITATGFTLLCPVDNVRWMAIGPG